MKKYIVMFGLTLVMGLFFANSLIAQPGVDHPLWTKPAAFWVTPAGEFLQTERLLADDRVRTSRVFTHGSYTRLDIGMGPTGGANLEMYRTTDPLAPGRLAFVYGGASGIGDIRFTHYNGSAFITKMSVDKDGNMDISGQLDANGAAIHGELIVDGKITSKEIEVKLDVWPDFVFADDYELMSLYEVENYIKQNRHLPNVPSEAQVLENGVNVGEMTSILLQKVEELTLHIIELNKRIAELEK